MRMNNNNNNKSNKSNKCMKWKKKVIHKCLKTWGK